MNQQLDPVSVAVVLASTLFGPSLAAIIGPYAVILLGATVGAAWALGRRDTAKKSNAVAYFALINGTAMLVTVSISNLVGNWLGHDDANWLLAPVAMVIGGVGHDWPVVLKTVQEKIMGLWGRRIGGDEKP